MDSCDLPAGLPDDLLHDELADLAQELAAADETTAAPSILESLPSALAAGATPAVSRLEALKEMLRRIDERTREALTASAHDHHGVRYLTLSIAGQRCAMPLANVAEVARVPPVAWLPYVPDWLTGVTNLRGRILSVIDTGRLLAGVALAARSLGRIVVVRPLDGEPVAALLVDAVYGIRELASATAPIPAPSTTADGVRYVCGLAEQDGEKVLLVDVEGLLAAEEWQQIDATRPASEATGTER